MTRSRVESLMTRHPHGVRFCVARPLKSLNRNRTWQMEHWESQAWERALKAAIEIRELPWQELIEWIPPADRAIEHGKLARVVVRRLVPSKRNFTKDADNLAFLTKPLNDALKRLGFIPSDTRKALEQPTTVEAVSLDGKFWTQLFISPVPPVLRTARP